MVSKVCSRSHGQPEPGVRKAAMISMRRAMSRDGFTALSVPDSHKTYYGIFVDILRSQRVNECPSEQAFALGPGSAIEAHPVECRRDVARQLGRERRVIHVGV